MPETGQADDREPVRYHFLDVGGLKYGECTLVVAGAVRVLIDGGHRKDFEGQAGYESIPAQLARILDEPAPHAITLLVVTHCHDDHIGCLVDLVRETIIRPEHALVTDPRLGFGRLAGTDVAQDMESAVTPLAAILREEDASDLSDADLAEFIDAVATAESRYADLMAALDDQGCQVIAYQGRPLPEAVATAVAPTGLTLLGPTEAQLLYCAERIASTNAEAQDAINSLGGDADHPDIVQLYRDLVGRDLESDARNPRGSGMNCQSITLAFGPPDARALLAGDMQFTEPGLGAGDAEVGRLREHVIAAGPYRLFKTTHHTSHNGQDAELLNALGSPPLVVHSGGVRDPKHPFPDVLDMLRGRPNIVFARTDRNGAIQVAPQDNDESAMTVQRGRLNDFTDNRPEDPEAIPVRTTLPPQPAAPRDLQPMPVASGSPASQGPQIIIVNPGPGPIALSVAGVEVRIGPVADRETSRYDPGATPAPLSHAEDRPAFAISRDLSGLVFVTNPTRLRANIGEAEAEAILAAVEEAGAILARGAGDALIDLAVSALRRNPSSRGVVLLGGYDVVPGIRTDAIGPELRRRLGSVSQSDADDFWIWSDRLYADVDGDHLAEYPVSRIPDARDAQLVRAALNARAFVPGERFGVRNIARPFAGVIWAEAPGVRDLAISETFLDADVVPAEIRSACHYFMLHGRASDGRVFEGEYQDRRGYTTAFTINTVPSAFDGVAIAGCCWGALVVSEKARDTLAAVPAPRAREGSIALSYLAAGACAFIGCTGAHYSGPDPDLDANYAARLHQVIFQALYRSLAPAQALHEARLDYLGRVIQAGIRDPLELSRRLKNAHQFTCLGLGW